MKFTKNEWIKQGINFLHEEGAHALMIDHMCDKLKITKGSFYHYFDSIDQFILLVIKQWQKEAMELLTMIEKSTASPEERLEMMKSFTFSHSERLAPMFMVAIGSLDDSSGLQPNVHIFGKDRQAWDHVSPEHMLFEHLPPTA